MVAKRILNRHDEFIRQRQGWLVCERCGRTCDVLHSVPRELVCAVCLEGMEVGSHA